MNFSDDKPIWRQIYELIAMRVLSTEWAEGSRIVSVRELASEVGVNPNTVMRSYELLQNKNIIVSIRGIGFSINENAKEIILEDQKRHFIEEELPDIVKKLKMFGISIEEIRTMYNEH